MKKFILYVTLPAFVAGTIILLSSSRTSPLEIAEVAADPTFVGSDICSICHSPIYNTWKETGHRYIFTIIENGAEPTYPPEAVNFLDQYMANLGNGTHTWSDIAGVIGGYGWKARFVGLDGHIVGTAGSGYSTGVGHNQFNFFGGENHGWTDYHPADVKVYDYACFKCHTTGADTSGTWLSGVDGLGAFNEAGISCEACHGPGSIHISTGAKKDIDRVYEYAHLDNSIGGLSIDGNVQMPDPESNDVNFLCGTCHNRGYSDLIEASDGFIRHQEQWDEFMASKHGQGGMTCISCHDPHKRVIGGGDGIIAACTSCHPDKTVTINHPPGRDCIDCHMPFASKSGTERGASGYKGDVRSHLFAITASTASMFTEDMSAVRDDEIRPASLSPAFACLGCHNDDPSDGIADKTLEVVAAVANGMHGTLYTAPVNDLQLGIYPNPANGAVRLNVNLPYNTRVDLSIFSSSGQVVFTGQGMVYPRGNQVIYWDGKSNTGMEIESGYYFVKVSAGGITSVDKLVIMK